MIEFIKTVEPIIDRLHVKKTIAIMGCAVNGIGECENADLGVYGNKTSAFIYVKGKLLKKIKHTSLVKEFKRLI
jgi:(E)-4-hydroxy-3-methylbut-2-enyl-diphosphate synthase